MARKKKKVAEPKSLTRVQFQEIRLNHLEMDGLKKDLANVGLVIETHELSKQRAILQRSDIKNKIKILDIEHGKLLDRIKKETGIDIKNKVINPETLEVS